MYIIIKRKLFFSIPHFSYATTVIVFQVFFVTLSRVAELAVEFGGSISPYCKTDEQINNVEASLKQTLIDEGISLCLKVKSKQCEIKFFECEHARLLLKLKFTLVQTFDLNTADIITRDVTKFKSHSFSIQYDDWLKRAIVLTDKASNKNTDVVTQCVSSVLVNPTDFCVSCGIVFGKSNDACQTCGIGYYSDATGVLPCTQYQDSKTTLAVQSEKAEDCVVASTVCTVPEAPTYSALIPASKSQVDEGSHITAICMAGFGTSFTERKTFKCATGSTVPSCHSKIPYGFYITCKS